MSHSSEASSYADETWTTWFCNLAGNHFFCEIDKSYIEDSFNLFGLKTHLLSKDYSKALDTILDRLAPSEAETEELSRSAALLYGLIHARYIITSHGLEAMHRKYLQKGFGECPRMLCRGQPVLPMSFTDDPKHGMVKLFCPKCQDVYSCGPGQRHIDGAFFGPTFPNLFFMTYEDLVPEPVSEHYVPRVFGFRIHHTSNSLPRPGAGVRGGLGLYAGYAGRGGGASSMAALGMAAGAAGHFGGVSHSLLAANAAANNNGNHTSTSISESQTGASVVRGKRRHRGYHTSASDGHQSATPAAGAAVSLSGTLISIDKSDVNPHLALSAAAGAPGGTTSAMTYTGLDGKIGIDIIEHPGGGGGVPSSSNFGAASLGGLGLGIHSDRAAGGVSTRERERERQRSEQEQRAPAAAPAPHQRTVPLTTVTGFGHDRGSDDDLDGTASHDRLPPKRARHSNQ